jgi:hypothetical protein
MGGGGKRKVSPGKLLNSSKFRKKETEEKISSQTEEKLSKQTTVAQSNAIQTQEATTLQAVVTQNQKCKPIMVDCKIQNLNLVVENIPFKAAPLKKIIANQKTQIICHNNADKELLINKLKEKNIAFHTFTENSAKSMKFVLKGHYLVQLDVMKNILQENNLQVVSISFLSQKEDYPIYIVAFDDSSINLPALNHNHKVINQLIVKWEALDNKKKKHTQCHNCQRWGHSSSNCGYSYRCIKCTENHKPGECKRTSRDDINSQIQCVNCLQSHAANSTSCEAFKKYIQFVDNKRGTKIKRQTELNNTTQNSSYAAILSSQNTHLGTQTAESADMEVDVSTISPNSIKNIHFRPKLKHRVRSYAQSK